MRSNYNKGGMSIESGQCSFPGEGVIQKGRDPRAVGLSEVLTVVSSAQRWLPMSSLHFFKLYVSVIRTHLLHIF